MRVLFDHNVPHGLRRFLPGHYVRNAAEMDWAWLSNGLLLKAAEDQGFDVMVTCDQSIYYQQNLKARSIALVVLTTNNWTEIRVRTKDILAAIQASSAGSFTVVRVLAV